MAEKKYNPTQKRLREAREKGEAVRSRDLTSCVSFLAVLVGFWAAGSLIWRHLSHIIDYAAQAADPAASTRPWAMSLWGMVVDAAWILCPLMILGVVGATVAGGMQTRWMISFTPITPNFSRLNPGAQIKEIFTVRRLLDLGKMVLKSLLLLGMMFLVVAGSLEVLCRQVYASTEAVLKTSADLAWQMMGYAAIIYLLTAIIDDVHLFFEFMKQQKMSVDEMRRDIQESEGNPLIKSRRRSLAHELLFSPALPQLNSANVVIVNPTHFAVALQYQAGTTPLPKVVAKGVDAVALNMRTLAERSGVPVLEDPPLARRLFSRMQVGDYIKDEFIDTVAAVFRWVRLLEEQRGPSVQLTVAEAESDAPHRVYEARELGSVDLPAESGDMHVNDVVEGGGTTHVFPNLVR
jgi:type III secretion protein U